MTKPSIWNRRAPFFALLCVIVLTAACALPRARQTSSEDEAHVRVQNRGWVDMTVYVVEGGTVRRRLGVAPATGSTTFLLPPEMVGSGRDLQFHLDPVGARGNSTTRRIFVGPGETVVLLVEP